MDHVTNVERWRNPRLCRRPIRPSRRRTKRCCAALSVGHARDAAPLLQRVLPGSAPARRDLSRLLRARQQEHDGADALDQLLDDGADARDSLEVADTAAAMGANEDQKAAPPAPIPSSEEKNEDPASAARRRHHLTRIRKTTTSTRCPAHALSGALLRS